jgi:deoxyhypusine synthase
MTTISDFMRHHYRHFNAATVSEATQGYIRHLDGGGEMLMTLAGAMSTAELGVSLAAMIRGGKVHAICCTGANLEEDLFNLVAHDHYRRLPNWRNLTPADEKRLEEQGLNRVTDTCIPEEEAIRAIEQPLLELWRAADRSGDRRFPHEFLYQLIESGKLEASYQIAAEDSWMIAACEKQLPIFVPGWEDSTLGNILAARLLDGSLARPDIVRSGIEYMTELVSWYIDRTMGSTLAGLAPASVSDDKEQVVAARAISPGNAERTVGFFQIGGGIAGDFPICVVPLIHQDLGRPCPYWGYFCQISDSTTSYGSYSGAFPSEKITWGKLDLDTPMYLIESDATIVAPLIFAAILEA